MSGKRNAGPACRGEPLEAPLRKAAGETASAAEQGSLPAVERGARDKEGKIGRKKRDPGGNPPFIEEMRPETCHFCAGLSRSPCAGALRREGGHGHEPKQMGCHEAVCSRDGRIFPVCPAQRWDKGYWNIQIFDKFPHSPPLARFAWRRTARSPLYGMLSLSGAGRGMIPDRIRQGPWVSPGAVLF